MDRIVETAPYGEHIQLTCKNHPNLRWSTKNIAPIGCRSIFYNLQNDSDIGSSCNCDVDSLIPVQKD